MAAASHQTTGSHVRLPPGVDKCMGDEVTATAMLDKVKSVASKLPPLIPREWTAVKTSSEEEEQTSTNNAVFRVMQFNMLAEGLSAGAETKPPFNLSIDGTPLSDSTYGGFSDVHLPEVCFNFDEVRRWRLLEEIIRVDADLISIEEIDHFNDFFEPALKKLGYDGVFVPKANSPSCSFGYFSDGVALFWRTSKFCPFNPPNDIEDSSSLETREAISLAQTPSPTVVACLEHIDSKRVSIVGVTHLKAKPGAVNEERRKLQIDAVLKLMADVASSFDTNNRPGLILMGDFNTDSFAHSEPKKLKRNLSEGGENKPKADDPLETPPMVPAQAVPHVVEWNNRELVSVYPLSKAEGEGFTTWKKRGALEVQHIIDYIFYTKTQYTVVKFLDSPKVEDIPAGRFPCLEYPSDHLSIAADLCFV